jgi:hypothetical protein
MLSVLADQRRHALTCALRFRSRRSLRTKNKAETSLKAVGA